MLFNNSAPCIINNVSTIGSVREDDLWPKGSYSSFVSCDSYNYVRFIVSVSKDKLRSFPEISARYKIFNESGNMVLDEVTNISWSPAYDRISLGWCIKGSDGSTVPVGNYRAELTVNDSLPYTCSFSVTSSSNPAPKPRNEEPKKESAPAVDDEQTREMKERAKRRQLNLCQYCAGGFKGIFTKKCSICGKPKDY